MPRVSVIIPTYNRSGLLREAVTGVLKQSFKDVEILIVDDGSSDDTAAVARGFEGDVRYFRQDHAGLNAARNLALAEARGEYVALLDDDDVWLPYKLALQVRLMDHFDQLAYLFSDFFIWHPVADRRVPRGLSTWHREPIRWDEILSQRVASRDALGDAEPGLPEFNIYIGDLYSELMRRPQVLPSCAMFRAAMVPTDVQFTVDDFLCGDWEFFARLSRLYPCAFIDMETTLNRSHGDAVRITRKSERGQLDDRLALLERVWQADANFYAEQSEAVDRVVEGLLWRAAKLALFEGDTREARRYLERMGRLAHRKMQMAALVLGLISRAPAGHKMLAGLRALRHRLANSQP